MESSTLPASSPEKPAATVKSQTTTPQTEATSTTEPDIDSLDDESANLKIRKAGEFTTLPVNAQLDVHILEDENGRLLLHTDPTHVYGHGIMGDELEAGSITLVATEPEVEIVRKIPVSDAYVLEGIAPIWVDFNGDGERDHRYSLECKCRCSNRDLG